MRSPTASGRTQTPVLSCLLEDVRFAFRTFGRTPVITAAAAATLALGIGLTTAICSVFESVLLNQLPFSDPDRVVSVTQESSDPRGRVTVDLLNGWRQRATTFASFAAYDDSQLLWHDRGTTEVLRGLRVTTDFFKTLRVDVALGRDFDSTDDAAKSDAVMLTYPLWASRFGSDPAVVGRTLDTDGGPRRIVGVLPKDFHGLRMSNPSEIPQYFAPLARESTDPAACDECTVRVLGRLAPGATADGARGQLGAIRDDVSRYRDAHRPRIYVVPLLDRLVGPIRNALWLMLCADLCVLLIACANIASVQVVRATAREREFATRTALGATRLRLASQLLVENSLLALVGGGAGVILGRVGTGVLATLAPAATPRIDEIHTDARVALFACVLSVVTGLVFGLAPLSTAARTAASAALSGAGRTTSHRAGRSLRNTLVIVDLAIAFALVMVTGLLGRSLGNLYALDLGFDPHDVLTLTPVASTTGPARTKAGRLSYYHTLMQRVAEVPGVTAVGMVSNVPLSNIEPSLVLTDADDPGGPGAEADWFVTGGDYFRALRIPVLAGRSFDGRDDNPAHVRSVVVSAAFAAHRLPGMSPLHHHVRFSDEDEWYEIVGVVGDVRYRALDESPSDAIYLPQSAYPQHYTRIVARTSGAPRSFQRAIVTAIRGVDAAEGIFHEQPMDDYVSSALADRSFPVGLMTLFAAVALLLSAVGLYGLLGFAVLQRTPEIGVRRALGATPRHVLLLIAREASAVTLCGLAAGTVVAWTASRFVTGWLFQIERLDAVTAIETAALLLFVSAAASAVPAVQAIKVQPMQALRVN